MQYDLGEEPRLPFPTRSLVVRGKHAEEYIIPENRREELLRKLYFFHPVPALSEQRLDSHTGRLFRVREFRVIRENGMNFLVSPFYEDGGASAIDWLPASRLPE